MSRHKIKAVVLDFSGTVLDKYALAPAVAFQRVFKNHGVAVSMAACREPMGIRKDLHINSMLKNPEIASAWKSAHGNVPNARVEGKLLYDEFVPLQLDVLHDFSDLLPGVRDTFATLRDMKVKIGGTTGFCRQCVDVLESSANDQGIHFDSFVAGDDVLMGSRPSPSMLYRNLDLMGITNINEVLKVDDTLSGISEGIAANCMTVAVSRWSNYMDIDSTDHELSLSQSDIEGRHQRCREILNSSGANFVRDDISSLPSIISGLNNY